MPARRAVVLSSTLAALALAPPAAADLEDEIALAERYAPVVRLVEQEEECGPGEPYEPLDVELLFDEPTVALRGPWGAGDLVEIGPSAEALADGLYEYHLDFPGNALDPRCDYERWARRLAEGHEPAVYAHVAADPAHPGQLALQYWLYYAFNDWNNLHEGDWEMIQLVFPAADARQALAVEPTSVGYSQHEGAERAEWGEDKLELVDGTHPVVHPAAGSHANFFEEALYLGSSAEQGVGCDDTTGPTVELRPTVFTIPGDPVEARSTHPWIEFEGRWGELQRAFFNGPTGPNLKSQWTEPITWSEGWRDRSYAVPAGGLLGTQTTDFFCAAVAGGSRALQLLLENPVPLLLLATALVALVLFGLSRATWRPSAPLRLVRRRSWGQVVSAAALMYRRRFPLWVGIGVLMVPLAVVAALLQLLVRETSSFAGVETEGEAGGLLGLIAFVLITALALLAVGIVQAAVARALVEIDEGRDVGPLRAYRLVAGSVRPLFAALVLAVVVVSALAGSLFLIPVAVWLAVRWSLLAPVVALEGVPPLFALRRSGRLVRTAWLKVASLALVSAAVALAAGPLLGAVLILVTSAPLGLVNAVAGVVYAFVIPFVGLTTAYVYFDTRVRAVEEREPQAEELPAELGPATS
ncbi:MAG TPA: hypothetical protein VD704_12570 [Gaiellaceae bacterium]|nr:hypothetical protein [Gaiellaceae bacterium]